MRDTDQPAWLHPSVRAESDLPTLHFVHGNSFPTGTYNVFLENLKSHYQIRALEMHGHNPAYPVTDGWPELCKELIASIELSQTRPVILLGHSMGGLLSLMVAKMRPDLVRCVVMLDSPVVAGWRAKVLQLAKFLRVDALVPPAKNAIKRRKSWSSEEEAYQHFFSKSAFSIWPERVLRDYIQFGMEPYPKGVTLRFKREIETAIYRTLPHAISGFTGFPFPVPIGFICGTTSQECRQAGIGHTQQLVKDNFEWIEGGHLYPLESPDIAARTAHALIVKLLSQKG
jgi:pimeloyl-ACP methyl ester carboxylesterase